MEYNVVTPMVVAAWAVMLFCCCAVVALWAALAKAGYRPCFIDLQESKVLSRRCV